MGVGGLHLHSFKNGSKMVSVCRQAMALISHRVRRAQVVLFVCLFVCFFLLLQVWQCGGRIEILPCSRIGHLERYHKPYALDLSAVLKRNALRVAEIWMDEYKDMVYLAWNIPLQVCHGIEQKQRRTKEELVVGNGRG